MIAYLAIRVGLSLLLGLRTATAGIGLDGLSISHLQQLVACLWAPFEGAWLLFGVGFVGLLGRPWVGRAAALGGFLYFGAYLLSCFLVTDVTRSMSFAFVAIFPLLKAMALRVDGARLRALLLLASLVSLLAPNLFVWHELTLEIGLFARILGAR